MRPTAHAARAHGHILICPNPSPGNDPRGIRSTPAPSQPPLLFCCLRFPNVLLLRAPNVLNNYRNVVSHLSASISLEKVQIWT